jgi:hypothetical protein
VHISIENDIDNLIRYEEVKPLDMILYILEQHLLEDGIKGQDVYQDLLGSAWEDLRVARSMFSE